MLTFEEFRNKFKYCTVPEYEYYKLGFNDGKLEELRKQIADIDKRQEEHDEEAKVQRANANQ